VKTQSLHILKVVNG